MGINSSGILGFNSSGFNGPSTNGISGQILFGQGTTATPIWAFSASLPPTPTVLSNYFRGYMGTTGAFWTVTSAGFTIPINTGGNTLVTVFQNGLTVVAAGNSMAAIIFTPAAANSVYEINAFCALSSDTSGDDASARLTDGSNPFAWGANTNQGGNQVTVPVGGIYACSSGNTLTISVQLCGFLGGNARIKTSGLAQATVPAIQWEIKQLA